MAVKENQAQLHEAVEDEFRFSKNIRTYVDQELDHGRIESRTCSTLTDFQFIDQDNKWKNLATVIKIESTRAFKNSEKPVEKATRYYISSLEAEPMDFEKAIRSHWGIENKLMDIGCGI